jgi:hypothetical protein
VVSDSADASKESDPKNLLQVLVEQLHDDVASVQVDAGDVGRTLMRSTFQIS